MAITIFISNTRRPIMSKFPVIIIDDLYGALEDTAAVIQSLSVFEIEGKFTSVRAAELFLLTANKRIHLIFCDIEMPECSGLDAIKRLRNFCDYFVFITGYADQYALQGHQVHVDGFLSKPVDADELLDLFHYLQAQARPKITDAGCKIESKILLDYIEPNSDLHLLKKNGPAVRKNPDNKREYAKVPVALAEIAYIEKMRNYIHFYALRSTDQFVLLGVLNKTLMDLQAMLGQDPRFVRINPSLLVNMNYVTKVHRDGLTIGPKYCAVSRSYAEELQQRLKRMDPGHIG